MIRATCHCKLKMSMALLAAFGVSGLATADTCMPPGARIFSSKLGGRAITVIAKLKPEEDCQREQAQKPLGERQFFSVTATMFTPDNDGQQKTIREATPQTPN
jgi:hypothetical protein